MIRNYLRRLALITAIVGLINAAAIAESDPIKQIYTETTIDSQIRNWVSYRSDLPGTFDLDKAIETAQKAPPFKGLNLDGMSVENITEWGFTTIVERILREHGYIVVNFEPVGAVEFYNIGNDETLVVFFKKSNN